MKNNVFDTITRHAAGVVSRRGSIRLLSGAALAGALATPELAGAATAGRRCKRQGGKRCKRQGGACRAFVAEGCAQSEDPQACEEEFFPCCAHFERCNAGAGLKCIARPIDVL